MAEHMVQVAYNAQHKIPWHWPVPAYLVTKGIGGGIFMFLSLGAIMNLFPLDSITNLVMGFFSLLFILITTGLLVHDLERPERFLSIIVRPQWNSWLARGAFLLIGFSMVAGLWWLIEAIAYLGWIQDGILSTIRPIAMWLGLPLAIGATIYTAFLFSQAEGRDLWQSSLLPIHLLIQAIMVGSGAFLLMGALNALPEPILQVARPTFISALIVDLLVILFGEYSMSHASEVAAQAAHEISRGRYKNYFWTGSVLIGHVLPLALLIFNLPFLAVIAAIAAIAGLYAFEYAFVMAPQEIPNS
jgi:formate-dependent nitrite reductase membrane component NrfD